MKKRAIFLDRDGTIIVDRGYLDNVKGVRLMPQAGEALEYFKKMGYALVIITNQSGVGRGKFTLEAVHAQHQRLEELLAPFHISFDDIQICPHAPDQQCTCRKPSPQLLLQAAQKLNLDLENSYMIGDKPSDVRAGIAAGCKTVYLGSYGDCPEATFCAASLKEAAFTISNPEAPINEIYTSLMETSCTDFNQN